MTFLGAAFISVIITLAIAKTAALLTNAPPTFAPFIFLPIASGCFGGALVAFLLFSALRLVFNQPKTIFFAAAVALLASFHLPFRITDHRSPRFAGATLPMQIILCVMHTVVAACCVLAAINFI